MLASAQPDPCPINLVSDVLDDGTTLVQVLVSAAFLCDAPCKDLCALLSALATIAECIRDDYPEIAEAAIADALLPDTVGALPQLPLGAPALA